MKEIPLTKGFVAFVDDDDYVKVVPFKWRANEARNTYYAVMGHSTRGDRWQMQDFIMGVPPPSFEWDHKNGQGLDNQRRNLRLATKSQNTVGGRLHSNNTSGFRGVRLHPTSGYQARITVNYKSINLGFYSTSDEAARAYDEAALRYYGEFANLNFPKT